jgi:hypothetical protein
VLLAMTMASSGAGFTLARFVGAASVAGNTMTTAAHFDVTPPTISSSVISKTTQYLPGYIRPSRAFYVYANVTDPGSGASGVATVTADVSSIKAGSTSVALVAGSYSVGGVSYGYRSASITADAKPAGTYSYTIRATDNAGNSATATFPVVVDSTAPSGSDIQTTNGGTAGRPDTGDSIVFTYSEQIDPQTVFSGWTGASTSVTVRFTDNGATDSLAIWNAANSAQLPLGSVSLNGDYVTANTVFSGTMAQGGATITVTLGTMSSGAVRTNTVAQAMNWTPSATATDAAGNACTTTPRTESGTNDVDF